MNNEDDIEYYVQNATLNTVSRLITDYLDTYKENTKNSLCSFSDYPILCVLHIQFHPIHLFTILYIYRTLKCQKHEYNIYFKID